MGRDQGDSVHFASLQALRGIAALLVVVVHAVNSIDWHVAHGGWADPGLLASRPALNEAGAMGVDLFFAISGFTMASVLARSDGRSVAAFARDRFNRIVPLYWLATLAFALLLWAAGRAVPAEELFAGLAVVPMALTGYTSPLLVVGWSLAFELAFYAIVALAFVVAPARRIALVAASMAVLAMAGAVLTIPAGLAAMFANAIVGEFLLGILVFLAWQRWGGHADDGPVTAALALVAMLWLGFTAVSGYPFYTPHLPVVAGDSGALRLMWWGLPWALILFWAVTAGERLRAVRSGIVGRALAALGDASYSLYLVHMFVTVAAERWMVDAGISGDAVVAALVMVSIAAGLAVHRWVEKPLLAALKRPARPVPAAQVLAAR